MLERKAIIYQSELDFISRSVLDYFDLETGGDFFGSFTRDGKIKIEYVIGPGKNTSRSAHSFYQDIEYLRICGNFLNSKFGLQHIGAWHSHHRLSLHHPSSGDVNTMRNALNSDSLSRFLISICNINNDHSVSVNPFMFERNNPNDYIQYEWHVLEGISPFREKIMRDGSELSIKTSSEQAPYSRGTIQIKDSRQKEKTEKPEMPSSSFWLTDKGKHTLKEIYESLKRENNVTDLEMLQIADSRIAFRYKHNDLTHEIILPHQYPDEPIGVIIKLPNGDFSNMEFPMKKKFFPSDMDLFLSYIEKKSRRKFF